MTGDRLALVELLQKSGDCDFLRAVAETVLQILMEADVEGLIGAGRRERSAERLNYRRYHDAWRGWSPCKEAIMDQSESVGTCGAAITVLVAIELSSRPGVLAVHDPITDKISRRHVDSGDAAGLIATCEKACGAAAGRFFEAVGVECVFRGRLR